MLLSALIRKFDDVFFHRPFVSLLRGTEDTEVFFLILFTEKGEKN